MRRNLWLSLIGIVSIAAVMLTFVVVNDYRPVLGLDLRGGVSVVLKPNRQVPNSSLSQAINIIRNRVDALGVAEPEITRQGANVVISLPGVKDPDRALALVGKTAELRCRPVLGVLPSAPAAKDLGTNPPPPPSHGDSCAFKADPDGTVPTTPSAWDIPENCAVLVENKTGTRYK